MTENLAYRLPHVQRHGYRGDTRAKPHAKGLVLPAVRAF